MQHTDRAKLADVIEGVPLENTADSAYTVEIDCVTESGWNEVLKRFDDATIYQTFEYGSIHWGRDELSHLILKENGQTVAAAQLRIVMVPFINRGIAYLPWGPLWRRKDRRRLSHLLEILRALHDEYVVRRKLLLRIQPADVDQTPDSVAVRLAFESEGYRFDADYEARRTFLLDLRPSLSELRGGLTRRWRRGLEKAFKNGLEIRTGTSSALLQELLQLYAEMLARKQFAPGVNGDEFGLIQEKLQNSEKMRIVIVNSNGVASAGTAISCMGEKAIPLLSATGESGLRTRASYLVQWKAIEWLKSKGALWYDLGGIDPVKNPGVYEFKRGLSGTEVSHLGRFEASESRISACISASRIASTLHRAAEYMH